MLSHLIPLILYAQGSDVPETYRKEKLIMTLSESNKKQIATSFTELAIQNDLIKKSATSAATAKEVATFFNTLVENLGDQTNEEED